MTKAGMKFIVKQILKNQKRFLKSKFVTSTSHVGATHKNSSITQSLNYINEVYNDYLQYGDLTASDLENAEILEVGPGDNFGVALKFLAAGAKKVWLVDKFYSERDEATQLKIYQAIREELSEDEKKAYDNCITFTANSFVFNSEKIEYIHGVGIEEEISEFKNQKFDLIISRAVLQEISKTTDAFQKMDSLLRTNGISLHKIDLRDYGAFSKEKNHQLGSLMYNSFIYKLMTNHSGLPNRKRVDYYRNIVKQLNYDFELYITHIFGEPEVVYNPHKLNLVYKKDYTQKHIEYIENIRKHLAREFRSISAEDLLVSGCFLRAVKK